MADFVHLHCHSQYSLRDGVASVEELVCEAKRNSMPAIALTDHGNMFGVIPFYKECKKKCEKECEKECNRKPIKPIIGVEAYIAPSGIKEYYTHEDAAVVEDMLSNYHPDDKQYRLKSIRKKYRKYNHHLVLLASNEIGFQNLIKLVSIGYTEGLYGKFPRVDKDLLRKYSDGLIGLSACMGGEVGNCLINNEYDKAEQAVKEYQEIFNNRFYLELMPHNGYNLKLIELSAKTSAELVATQDVHYISDEDWDIREVVRFHRKDEEKESPIRHDLSFKTRAQMKLSFVGIPEEVVEKALDNTSIIAEQCDVKLPHGEGASSYPRYHKLTSKENELEEANNILRKRISRIVEETGISNDKERMERIDLELDVICGKKLASYFLTIADILENAGGEKLIFCNARGSAAGSYIAYLLGITQVDPIEHGLLFQRFLNPVRKGMPDIDIDVEDNRRQEIFDYIADIYGRENVARLSTFNTLKPKSALNLTAKHLNIPENIKEEIFFLMKDKIKVLKDEKNMAGKIINECMKLPAIKRKMDEDIAIRKFIELAGKSEGVLSSVSLHPAGILVSSRKLNNLIPFWRKKNEIAIQVNYKDSKDIGLKYDFLLSKALTVIRETIKQVDEIHNVKIDMDGIFDEIHDPKVYEMIGASHTTTIFQLNSDLAKQVSAKVKPKDFDELVILNAMLRPAPVKDGKIDEYIKNRDHGHNNHEIEACAKILEETKGVLFLQEQIMQICVKAAGFNLADADTMRSLLGKKKFKEGQEEELESLKSEFKKGILRNGHSETQADNLLEELTSFSKYCFNKSHCVSYARLIYVTAYLKFHYPEIYMCSWLNHANVKEDRIAYLNECKRLGIKLLTPDINASEISFVLKWSGKEVGGVRFGLGHIKHVAKYAGQIFDERNTNGQYKSLQDFLQRMADIKKNDRSVITSKRVEALVLSGAFDSFNPNRNLLLKYVRYENQNSRRKQLREIENKADSKIKLPKGFSDEQNRRALHQIISSPIKLPDSNQKTKYEVEYLGTYLPSEITECINNGQDYFYLPPIEKILNSPDGTLFQVLGFVEEIGQEKRNRYNQVRIPLILSDPTGKLKLNLDKFKFRPVLQYIEVGSIVSVLANTKVMKSGDKRYRIFHPKRIQILG